MDEDATPNRSLYQRNFRDRKPGTVGRSYIPYRPFFWTLDQIGTMTASSTSTIKNWCYFEGRSTGVCGPERLRAVNFAGPHDRAEFRVEDKEFRRWMIHRGIRLYPPRIGRLPEHEDPTSSEPEQGSPT